MANPPRGSDQLRYQPKPHHYQSNQEIQRNADKLLEELAHKLAQQKGCTVAEAREELRHWI